MSLPRENLSEDIPSVCRDALHRLLAHPGIEEEDHAYLQMRRAGLSDEEARQMLARLLEERLERQTSRSGTN